MTKIEQRELIELIIYTTLAVLSMAIVLVVFFYFSRKKITEYEFFKRDQEIAHQKKLMQTIIETQEKERKRIAQDLHDDISSKLNIVSLNSFILQNENLTSEEKETSLKSIINNTKNALESSRQIAHNLYPPVLEKFGLEEAINELVYEINQLGKTKMNYNNTVNLNSLKIDHQVHFFRIIQELTNNSLKHSNCNVIELLIKNEDDKNICIYTDNGIGIKNIKVKNGLGLNNIETRIKLLNGTINIDNNFNGFYIKFNF